MSSLGGISGSVFSANAGTSVSRVTKGAETVVSELAQCPVEQFHLGVPIVCQLSQIGPFTPQPTRRDHAKILMNRHETEFRRTGQNRDIET